jgi:hypothetical protein
VEIPSLVDCTTVFLCGPVSSGKTWLEKRWIDAMERSIIVDTTAACMGPEFEHVWDSPLALVSRVQENPHYYRMAYHPGENYLAGFDWCVNTIWVAPHPRWIIIDEIHEVCGVMSIQPKMEMLTRYSRHVLLGVVGSSQSIQSVSKLFTSSCRMVVLFHTQEARDMDAIRERYGRDVQQQVDKLRPCLYDDATQTCEQEPECLVWVRGRGTKVFSLGDKRKAVETQTSTGEIDIWQSPSVEEQRTPEAPSLALPSGSPE